MQNGKKNWYVVDGWIPRAQMTENSGYLSADAFSRKASYLDSNDLLGSEA